MLNKYLFSLLNVHLPNRRIDVSKLYYDRKFGSAPPGTRIDLRYATILADLGLPSRAHTSPPFHRGNDAVVNVQVGSADRASGDLDDGIAR